MLILDKHRAIERMMALTARHEDLPLSVDDRDGQHGRRRQRVATFERRASAAVDRRAQAAAAAQRLRPSGNTGGISMA